MQAELSEERQGFGRRGDRKECVLIIPFISRLVMVSIVEYTKSIPSSAGQVQEKEEQLL